jgi:hypothetical protein
MLRYMSRQTRAVTTQIPVLEAYRGAVQECSLSGVTRQDTLRGADAIRMSAAVAQQCPPGVWASGTY